MGLCVCVCVCVCVSLQSSQCNYSHIERCKTEGVVDVFQVVKALRVQKPGAVQTVVSNYTCK